MTASTASSRQSCGAAGASNSTFQVAHRSGPARCASGRWLGGEQAAGDLGPAETRRASAARRRTRDSSGTPSWQMTKRRRSARRRSRRRKCASGVTASPPASSARWRQLRRVLLPPQGVDREVAGGAVEPAGRVVGTPAGTTSPGPARALPGRRPRPGRTGGARDRVSTATSRPDSWRKKCSPVPRLAHAYPQFANLDHVGRPGTPGDRTAAS